MSVKPGTSDHAERLRSALVAIQKLNAKVAALEAARNEPIAVVGMACRFPRADGLDAYWRLLHDGVDAISEVPPSRWDADAYYDPDPSAPGKTYTRFGGFLDEVDTFDALFFGISPREAVGMDPQHRLLLEVAWTALEHAGLPPARLAGTRTGGFVGITTNDYSQIVKHAGARYLDAYHLTGCSPNLAARRVSYLLGLHGPSMAVDTACSSSLTAVHLACQSLRAGDCDVALAGGVNLILAPDVFITASKARMLAPDGRCKTFAASADGFGRGEGCGVIVLKRLSQAIADGDRILGVIRGSDINQDGATSGLTVPNRRAQEATIRRALANAGIEPNQVQYVEAHGTGTPLGDPIEVRALASVLGPGRPADRPFLLGSVKTNIGHLESAAGIAGLIKVLLALQHRVIPPHLHFDEPTPHVEWDRIPVRVPVEPTPWSDGEPRRVAGISSFGASGTNVHLVVEEAPPAADTPAELERPIHILSLSAKSAAALREHAGNVQRHLAEAGAPVEDACYTANTGRSHFGHRVAVVGTDAAELADGLATFVSGGVAPGVSVGEVRPGASPEVVFLFTGQGSQYAGMGRELYESSPVFRSALDRCAAVLEGELEVPLLEVLYPEPGGRGEGLLERTEYTQPALFALEWSLAELWRSWGVEPSLVLVHSVGEYVAACVAGVLEVEEALRLVAARGRLMGSLSAGGVMVAVFAAEARVREVVERV